MRMTRFAWLPALAVSSLLRASPGVAETCATAIDVGTIPPEYVETGITVGPTDHEWRSFTLPNRRAIRFEAPGVELYVQGDCDSFPERIDVCLDAGTYHMELVYAGVPVVDLRIRDLGVCPRDFIVSRVTVEDQDGDRDGFADSGETADLRVTLSNKSPESYTNLVLQLSSSDPKTCLTTSVATIPSLPAHSDAEVVMPFRFLVLPAADRGGPGVTCTNPGPAGACSNFVVVPGGCASNAACLRSAVDLYAAAFALEVVSDQAQIPWGTSLDVDLDLDAASPAGATTSFVEGFESGLGSFELENLDVGKASNSLSDGFRCQYTDPDFENSNSYGETECYLGFSAGQSIANDWHQHVPSAPDAGRAFAGGASLHYGKHVPGQPQLDTVGLSQLDAVRSTSGIPLAARICRDDPAPAPSSCLADADCVSVGGGPCIPARPELSFKQQISVPDSRSNSIRIGTSLDRAVVEVQPAGGVWEKVEPYRNVYDVQATDNLSICMFDPIDDGNDEDSFFDPEDPGRRLGPSSTCMPAWVFGSLGDTDQPFAVGNVGRASDGPGLAGSVGTGTWVESSFDLSRYRGRVIKLRFLYTSPKIGSFPTYQSIYTWNPIEFDDGWYVDDVRVTQAQGAGSPSVTIDSAAAPPSTDTDGDQLPDACDPDDDGDAVADLVDCRPLDATQWAAPGEATSLFLAGKGPTTLSWAAPSAPGSSAVLYDVLRSASPASFLAAACVASDAPSLFASDTAAPPPVLFAYLVRAENACGAALGTGSGGTPRAGPQCP